MKNPAERLGEVITRVDDARDVMHDDFTILFPFLDGEVLDGDMTRTIGGDACIDHVDRGHIVFVDVGGCGLGVAQFVEHRPKELGVFGSHDSSIKFGFGGASGCGGLGFGAIGDGSATEENGIAGGRAAIA